MSLIQKRIDQIEAEINDLIKLQETPQLERSQRRDISKKITVLLNEADELKEGNHWLVEHETEPVIKAIQSNIALALQSRRNGR